MKIKTFLTADIRKIPSATTSPTKLFDLEEPEQKPEPKPVQPVHEKEEIGKHETVSSPEKPKSDVGFSDFGFKKTEEKKESSFEKLEMGFEHHETGFESSEFRFEKQENPELRFAAVEQMSPSFEEAKIVEPIGMTLSQNPHQTGNYIQIYSGRYKTFSEKLFIKMQ